MIRFINTQIIHGNIENLHETQKYQKNDKTHIELLK